MLALQKDARASVVELARSIGLSRSATQERMARLERGGAIGGYTVRRGNFTRGPRVRAFLTVRHADKGSCARLVPLLRGRPQFSAIHQLSGEIDLLIEAEAANTAEIDEMAEVIRVIPGVARVTTHIVLGAESGSGEAVGNGAAY